MSIATPSKLDTVQAMRGLAALGVVFVHLAGLQMVEGFRETTGGFAHGWIGVDLFFMISGFIMVWVTGEIASTPKTGSRFMALRAARIFPLWWVCVSLVGLFFALIHGVPASLDDVSRAEAWPYFISSFFLIPGEKAPLLTVGWTLIHELFFYLVFALIIGLGFRRRLVWALPVWAGFTALGLYFDWNAITPALAIIFNPLSFLFMAGVGVALLLQKYRNANLAWFALIIGVAAIAVLIFSGALNVHHRVTQLILPFSFILYGSVCLENMARIKTHRLLVWLGAISYSLYLTHPIVILAWRVLKPFYPDGLFAPITKSMPVSLLIYVDIITLLTCFLIVGHIFHHLIELPSYRFAKNRIRSYRRAGKVTT